MVTSNFTFLSNDRKTKIHAVKWVGEKVCAVLQIAHGMTEFIERYDIFAEFLVERGYVVVGHDHIGHGESVGTKGNWGFFCEENPSDILVEDMHKLRLLIQEEYPQVPYFMLGHSMGSFLVRKYLGKYHVQGAILMGTGFIPQKKTALTLKLTSLIGQIRGSNYRSKMIKNLVFGASYKAFDMTGKRPYKSWLTKDADVVNEYYKEPKCTFDFTINGYIGLFEAVNDACNQEYVNQYAKDLSVLLVSGKDDPVGDMGAGVMKTYHMLETAGLSDITYKLYENDRHELLHETDKGVIFQDLYDWMNMRVMKYKDIVNKHEST